MALLRRSDGLVFHVGEVVRDGGLEGLLHVGFQSRLIRLQREDIVPLLVADLPDNLFLATHRIDGHGTALQSETASSARGSP